MKPISTLVHGVLDYLTAAVLILVPRLFKWNTPTRRLLTGAAAGTAAYSLLTDYELGLVRVIPMKGHLVLDSLQSFLLGTAPFVFQKIGGRSVTAGLLGISLFEALVVMNSESRPRS